MTKGMMGRNCSISGGMNAYSILINRQEGTRQLGTDSKIIKLFMYGDVGTDAVVLWSR